MTKSARCSVSRSPAAYLPRISSWTMRALVPYDSCYRARVIFGITHAVLVTQRFHLPRALYTCLQLGVDAVGLGTPDWGVYSSGVMAYYSVRESLATFKALWDLHITRPPPTFLGPFEGI